MVLIILSIIGIALTLALFLVPMLSALLIKADAAGKANRNAVGYCTARP